KAAVVGMGTRGTGIAHALAAAGVPVVVRDEEEAALQKGMERIRSSLGKRVEQGQRSPQWLADVLERITPTTRWQEVANADVVIESVFENVSVKRAVIERLEAICAPDTIIATNTSTISLDELGVGMRHGERLIGLHFFNPAHHMPLVEIIRREDTAGSVIAAAMKFAKTIRKTPVLVRNREGFLVNRIFVPYLKEAFWLLEEGAEAAALDGAMVDFGFSMGPLALIDMAGLDILVFSDRVLSRAFPRHGALSQVAVRLVERGQLGQKTGAGVYKYERGEYAPRHSETTAGILADVRREQGLAPRKIEKDEIIERLALRMVSEAFYLLEEGIVQRPSDLDVATVLGIGFPDFRGGVLQYARDLGVGHVVSRLEKLAERSGERFLPCRMMREHKGVG
ncbi:MAG: 3-hydroxyacyl-CoA dehydrogenase NAD-binding domain-containing protein, partial [Planctomycetota bacterium]|nr:3-hydroxyacyl-CoA dehydrogenase NAD-binding domain-containing protein [Planctomycetota bacterium]